MDKSPYHRTTRDCSLTDLRPELLAAIRAHVEERKLGDVEAQMLICCETTNEQRELKGLEKLRARLLGPHDPDPVHYTGVVVTPAWLIWTTSGAKRGTVTLSARLRDVEIREFSARYAEFGIEDSGIDVFGLIGYSAERGSVFIGLGREPAAEKLKDVLRGAVQQAT